MRDIFLISDTHFNHNGSLLWDDEDGNVQRNFSCVEEMNEHMIERWNSVVKQGDIVYHVGDVFLSDKEQADKILTRLNGKKRLLLGNHDNGKCSVLQKHFSKINVWRMFKEFEVVLTHVPIYLGNNETRRYDYNIHGHIHKSHLPSKKYGNVSVEVIDYTPVEISSFCKEKFGVEKMDI